MIFRENVTDFLRPKLKITSSHDCAPNASRVLNGDGKYQCECGSSFYGNGDFLCIPSPPGGLGEPGGGGGGPDIDPVVQIVEGPNIPPPNSPPPTEPPPIVRPERPYKECYNDDFGMDYFWKRRTIMSGLTCQLWATNEPHGVDVAVKRLFGRFHGPDENFCRNVVRNKSDSTMGIRMLPWCYTTDPNKVWEYCNIPKCYCYEYDDHGASYAGKVSYTKRGQACLNWDETEWKDSDLIREYKNECRNPNGLRPMPYCFAKYPNQLGYKMEYCDIKICPKEQVPEPPPTVCAVKETISPSCSTVEITGANCYYSSDKQGQCRFTLVHESASKRLVFLHSPRDRVIELDLRRRGEGKNFFTDPEGCGEFMLVSPNQFIHTSNTCGFCSGRSWQILMDVHPSNPRNPTKCHWR